MPILTNRLNQRPPLLYASKIKALLPIIYLPLSELSGSVAYDATINARNGTYSNVTLLAAPLIGKSSSARFNGTSSFCNFHSAAFEAAWNGAEFTIEGWAQVASSGVWTDAASRCLIRIRRSASSDRVDIVKSTVNNQLDFIYIAGGTTKSYTHASFSPILPFHIAITVSASADQVKVYVNGIQVSSTLTGLGVWGGTLDSTQCCLGSVSTAGNTVWSGTQGHWAIWNRALTASEIYALVTY